MSSTRAFRASTPTQNIFPQTVSSTDMKSNENRKIREWIRELLREYLAKYVRDFLSQKDNDVVPSPVTSLIVVPDGNGNREAVSTNVSVVGHTQMRSEDVLVQPGSSTSLPAKGRQIAEKNLGMGITISELTMEEETRLGDDRITYLSRILSLEVKYAFGDGPDHFVNWLVKMPSKLVDEKNLARVTLVYSREVSFYSNIAQGIKHWLEVNYCPAFEDAPRFSLNIPTCYYARYEEVNDVDEDDAFPNPEFTLVLDDLRAQGFGKRHYSVGLTFSEALEAVREIAKFHAVSWAMTEHSGDSLVENWSQGIASWEFLRNIYVDMVRQGFRDLRRFRKGFITEKTLGELMDSLLSLESKLPFILTQQLKPLPPPAVTSLVHMDLWTENLMFREDGDSSTTEADSNEPGPSSRNDDRKTSSAKDLDCMILDWQMVSFGRISHDLGILLMSSLDGRVRRTYEKSLLSFYFETFEKIASLFKLEIPFDLDDLTAEYKDSCLLATMLAVTRLDLVTSEETTLQRFFEALEDLKEMELI